MATSSDAQTPVSQRGALVFPDILQYPPLYLDAVGHFNVAAMSYRAVAPNRAADLGEEPSVYPCPRPLGPWSWC